MHIGLIVVTTLWQSIHIAQAGRLNARLLSSLIPSTGVQRPSIGETFIAKSRKEVLNNNGNSDGDAVNCHNYRGTDKASEEASCELIAPLNNEIIKKRGLHSRGACVSHPCGSDTRRRTSTDDGPQRKSSTTGGLPSQSAMASSSKPPDRGNVKSSSKAGESSTHIKTPAQRAQEATEARSAVHIPYKLSDLLLSSQNDKIQEHQRGAVKAVDELLKHRYERKGYRHILEDVDSAALSTEERRILQKSLGDTRLKEEKSFDNAKKHREKLHKAMVMKSKMMDLGMQGGARPQTTTEPMVYAGERPKFAPWADRPKPETTVSRMMERVRSGIARYTGL